MNETLIREINDYATATCVADRLAAMFDCNAIKHRITMRRIVDDNRQQTFQILMDDPFNLGIKLDDSVKNALGLIIDGLVILVNTPRC